MNAHQEILSQVTQLAQGSATQDDLINAIYAVITKNLADNANDRFNQTAVKNAISLSPTIQVMAERAKPRLLHIYPSPVETFSVGGAKVEVMNEYPRKPKVMNVEPNWQGMFDFAINIARTEIDEGKGRGVVLEMLEYGKRLDAEYQAEPKVTDGECCSCGISATDGIFNNPENKILYPNISNTAWMCRDCNDDLQEHNDLQETMRQIKYNQGFLRDEPEQEKETEKSDMVKCFNCGYTDEKEVMNPVDDRRSFGDLVNPNTPWYCDDCSEVGEKARLEYEVTD